jgi:hypothetical protein
MGENAATRQVRLCEEFVDNREKVLAKIERRLYQPTSTARP